MGYSRSQIMFAFLLESLLIAMVGGALGSRWARSSTAGRQAASSAGQREAESLLSCGSLSISRRSFWVSYLCRPWAF